MRRGAHGTDAFDTINAAATAIASGEARSSHASVQKRKWASFWNLYWCFRSNKNKRIGHAVLVPETTSTLVNGPTAEHPSLQPPSVVLPFVAPPSSPASFLPSEPPSATQSPTGIFSLTSVSASMYSPSGPASMFTIGPYAHETQLVSPPVFSTFTTEPSTAPYTPPPESAHMTTPSSPEVPFARLLEPNLQDNEAGQRYPLSHQYEFQSYQLQPGSPVSHLISPSSGISGSGTSSPFPDREFAGRHPFFLELRNSNPPKLLDLDKIVLREWESRRGSGMGTPDVVGPRECINHVLEHQNSDIAPHTDTSNTLHNDDGAVVNHRVSFEITNEEVIRCVEKKPGALSEPLQKRVGRTEQEIGAKKMNRSEYQDRGTFGKDHTDGENERRHQKNRTITLGSTKEFNFENVDGGSSCEASIVSSDWWVNEKVVAEEEDRCANWSFFPMMQTGVS